VRRIAILGLALGCGMAYGQPPAEEHPTFEVASIKPSDQPNGPGVRSRVGCNGGPGRGDPGLFTCTNMSATNLVTMAYDLPRYALNFPDWMGGTRFDISAKVPPGTTKEQFRQMQQNLLVERFKLAFHHEKKEMQVYDLVVGKNGPKLKDAAPPPETKPAADAPPAAPPGPPKLTLGADGFPVMPAGRSSTIMMNGRARMQQMGETMDGLAEFLAAQLGRPVTNSTGLAGKYDIVLSWAFGPTRAAAPEAGGATPAASEPDGPTLLQAVAGLGLRLEQKKAPIDIVVIDHMEKKPAEN